MDEIKRLPDGSRDWTGEFIQTTDCGDLDQFVGRVTRRLTHWSYNSDHKPHNHVWEVIYPAEAITALHMQESTRSELNVPSHGAAVNEQWFRQNLRTAAVAAIYKQEHELRKEPRKETENAQCTPKNAQ